MLKEICESNNVNMPNWNCKEPNNKTNPTAVTMSALTKGRLLIDSVICLVTLRHLDIPNAANVPIMTDIIVEIIATKTDIKTDCHSCVFSNNCSNHWVEKPPKMLSLFWLLKANKIRTAIGM